MATPPLCATLTYRTRTAQFPKDLLKAWSETNTDSDIPRFQFAIQDVDDDSTSSMSNRFVTDASTLTLQNINLGYTLPEKLVKKLGMSKIPRLRRRREPLLLEQAQGSVGRRTRTCPASGRLCSDAVRALSRTPNRFDRTPAGFQPSAGGVPRLHRAMRPDWVLDVSVFRHVEHPVSPVAVCLGTSHDDSSAPTTITTRHQPKDVHDRHHDRPDAHGVRRFEGAERCPRQESRAPASR